ncbi:MAG: alpha/beta hydrolase [Bacteroidia bacterium]|jgi:acetyl esterase/lipase
MMRICTYCFLLSLAFLVLTGCAVKKSKDITYSAEHKLQLDVYSPKKKETAKPVFIFIHGGSWNSGKKSMYDFLGKGMVKNGAVAVIIDYRLNDRTTYDGMAADAATAVEWIKQNISAYGGDTSKIYISGHSAGGHLAALIATDNTYFNNLKIPNPIRGTILIDGFGLDINSYLKNAEPKYYNIFTPTFTSNQETWVSASPISHLHKGMPPFLMFLGGKTGSGIIKDNSRFYESVMKIEPDTKLIVVKRKRHIGMIFQYVNRYNKGYKEIIGFMKEK